MRGAVLLLTLSLVSCFRMGMGVHPDGSSTTDVEPGLDLEVRVDAGIDTGKPDQGPAPDVTVDSSVKPDQGPAPDATVDSSVKPDGPAPDVTVDSTQPDATVDQGSLDGWVLPQWSYRRTLTVLGRTPAATLTDFPILIDIKNDTGLRDHARSDGHDIRFTTLSGAPLEHETETYDPVTGSLLAWVKLPSLDTASGAVLLLYYGNSAAAADPSVTTVWSNAYLAVWHLGESGSGVADEFQDSSGNGNHARGGGGAKNSTPARQGGQIGFGQDGDGSNDFIATPVQLGGQSLTVTAWFNVRRTDNMARPGLCGQNDALEIGFYWTDRINVWTPTVTTMCPGKNVISACTPDFLLKTWMQLTLVLDGANATLYIDGVQKHVAVSPGVGTSTYLFTLMGRVFDGTGNYLDGMLDEVRLAQAARSAAWISTQHATQSDPASFYTLGPEQLVP